MRLGSVRRLNTLSMHPDAIACVGRVAPPRRAAGLGMRIHDVDGSGTQARVSRTQADDLAPTRSLAAARVGDALRVCTTGSVRRFQGAGLRCA